MDVCRDGWMDGRSYHDIITKISQIDGLTYFLSNGALLARVELRYHNLFTNDPGCFDTTIKLT